MTTATAPPTAVANAAGVPRLRGWTPGEAGPANVRVGDERVTDDRGLLLPHVRTFNALFNAFSKTYSYRWDEAVRHGQQYADAMRRDAFLRALEQERLAPLTGWKWDVIPDADEDGLVNPKDPRSVDREHVGKQLKAIIGRTRGLIDLRRYLGLSEWFGRYGSQVRWDKQLVCGWPRHVVGTHVPIDGDKIHYDWDGVPGVMIRPADKGHWPDVRSWDGGSYLAMLSTRGIRQRFIIQQFFIEDASYWDAQAGGRAQGVGYRDFVYWAWWLRDEMLSWLTDFMSKIGNLGLLLFYYDEGNPTARASAEKAAKDASGKNALAVPIPRGSDRKTTGVELIAANLTGVQFLKEIVGDYFERHIERLIVGQSMSGGSDNGDGLGGTGRAQLAKDTKWHLLRWDAEKQQECLTHDLVEPAKEINFEDAPWRYQWKYALPDPEAESKLNAIAKAAALPGKKLSYKAAEVLELVGMTKPDPGDEIVGGDEPPPGMPGAPGMPGPGGPPQVGPDGQPIPGGPPQVGPDGQPVPAGQPGAPAEPAPVPGMAELVTAMVHAAAAGDWQTVRELRLIGVDAHALAGVMDDVERGDDRPPGPHKAPPVDYARERPWDESQVTRETEAHDGKRPGEFAPAKRSAEAIQSAWHHTFTAGQATDRARLFDTKEGHEAAYQAHVQAWLKHRAAEDLAAAADDPGESATHKAYREAHTDAAIEHRTAADTGAKAGMRADVYASPHLDRLTKKPGLLRRLFGYEAARPAVEYVGGRIYIPYEWAPATTKSGHVKAVWSGAGQRMPLYGEKARQALQAKHRGGDDTPPTGTRTAAAGDDTPPNGTPAPQPGATQPGATQPGATQPGKFALGDLKAGYRQIQALNRPVIEKALADPGSVQPHELPELALRLTTMTKPQLRQLAAQVDATVGGTLKIHLMRGLLEHVRNHRDAAGNAPEAHEQARSALGAGGVPLKPEPGRVYSIASNALKVDPARFQYKISGIGEKGVTDELKDVEYDPQLAGVIHAWKDPATGEANVVNGHHRDERAKAAGVTHQNVMFIDAKTAEEARSVGALINIAEGKGTPLDAAKFMRDTGTTPDDFKKRNVPIKGTVARDGAVLAKLADPLFGKLAQGRMDQDRALALAANLPDDPEGQVKLAQHIEQQEERTGKEVPPKVVAEAAKDYASAPTQSKTENTLFGTTEEEENLFLTRAELKTWAKQQLSKHAADFKAVSSERRAANVAGAGNTLNVEANKAEAGKAAGHVADFDRQARNKGPVADLINSFTKEYASAAPKQRDAVKQRFLEQLRPALAAGPVAPAAPERGAEGAAVRPVAAAAAPATGGGGPGAAPAAAGVEPERPSSWLSSTGQQDFFGGVHHAPRPSPAAVQPSLVPREAERAADAEDLAAGLERMKAAGGGGEPAPEDFAGRFHAAHAAGDHAGLHDLTAAALRGEHGPDVKERLGKAVAESAAVKETLADKYHRLAAAAGPAAHPASVQDRTLARAKAEYPQLRDRYLEKHATRDAAGNLTGMVLNTDDWRDLFPEYHGTNAHDVHEAASHLNKQLYAEALRTMKGKGNGKMLVLAGGGGSGKGTATRGNIDQSQYPIVLDQASDNYPKLEAKLDEAKAAGFTPEMVFVDRSPADAWNGVVGRALRAHGKGGTPRTVPLAVAFKANVEARKATLELLKRRPDVEAGVIDNTGSEPGARRYITDRAEAIQYLEGKVAEDEKAVAGGLKQHLEADVVRRHLAGDIPEHVAVGLVGSHAVHTGRHKQAEGEEHGPVHGREPVPPDHAAGPEPEPAAADRRAQPGRAAAGAGGGPAPEPEPAGPAAGTGGEAADSVALADADIHSTSHPTPKKDQRAGLQPFVGTATTSAGGFLATFARGDTKDEAEQKARAALKERIAARTPRRPAEPPGAAKPADGKSPHVRLSDAIAEKLKGGGTLTAGELFKLADEHHGGTRAQGKYGPSEAYDSLEAGFNKALAGQTDPTADLADAQEQARQLAARVDALPTQTNRSGNKDAFQQFSTPPHYAFAANWVANLKPGDTVLEPTAGTGSLAVHAKNAGAHVVANELDPKRLEHLRSQFGKENVHGENAEQIGAILPKKGVKPTVVVMNPPFSQTAGRMGDNMEKMTGARHIDEALRTLPEGGRLVAIVAGGTARTGGHGAGMSPDSPFYRPWFEKLGQKYNLRANVGVAGDEYKKYGTNFGTRLLVIDKTGPHAGDTVTGDAADVPDLMAKLEGVRNDRPQIAGRAPGQPAGGAPAPGGGAAGRPAADAAGATGAVVPADGGVAGDVPVREPVGRTDAGGGEAVGAGPGGGGDDAAGGPGGVREGPGGGAGGDAAGPGAGRGGLGGAGGAPGTAVPGPARVEPAGGRPAARRKLLPGAVVALPELRQPERLSIEPAENTKLRNPVISGPAAANSGLPENRKSGPAPTAGEGPGGSAPNPDAQPAEDANAQLGESLYESYRPAAFRIPGAKPHASPLVESAAMAAVRPPAAKYQPHLSPDLVSQTKTVRVMNADGSTTDIPVGISEAGLESVVYAGQAHEKMLPAADGPALVPGTSFTSSEGTHHTLDQAADGSYSLSGLPHTFADGREVARFLADGKFTYAGGGGPVAGPPPAYRRGYFIGDGTGAGKGRQVAGIITDNWNQGRKRHVWVTQKQSLINDARRDWRDVGNDPDQIVHFDQIRNGATPPTEGVAFITYDTLKGRTKDPTAPSNLDQLVKWLGPDFDGVIAFDEAHSMANGMETEGARGPKDASQRAIAGIELQKRLPNARVAYVSATGATEVANLAYAERLGLWGRGTPFPTKQEFVNQMNQGGVAAMEAVAQSLKATGSYAARSLSFDGVTYDRLTHTLSDEQKGMYDTLAEGWQHVLRNIDAALEVTGGDKSGQASQAAKSAFWGAQQRFFNQLMTSMQTPSVIRQMEKDLAEGKAPVIQLVNTMEKATERARARLADDEDLDAMDVSPREGLMQFLEKSFPVHRYEQFKDENGNVRSRLVQDAEGKPVEDPEAVAKRDELLTLVGTLRIPESPLDMIVNHFGTDVVAEATGRKQRLVHKTNDRGQRVKEFERRGDTANAAEAQAFQAGRKKVMVFSDAGGTGSSYHADRSATNQAQRVHYMLQPGWRADNAVQGLGRTHRTNQVQPPIYRLVQIDQVKAQKRFVSTIARRLDQLGALTRGQRQAGSSGLFAAADNLESPQAKEAMDSFFRDVKAGRVEGIDHDDLVTQLGLKKKETDENKRKPYGKEDEEKPASMGQFLNRLLSLKVDTQGKVFEAYDHYLGMAVERAAQEGSLDTGVENYPADKIVRTADRVVHTDPDSGAEARLLSVRAHRKTESRPWSKNEQGEKPQGYVSNKASGRVWAVYKGGSKTDATTGSVTPLYRLVGPGGTSQFKPQHEVDAALHGWAGPGRPSNWEKTDEGPAREQWEKEYAEAPKFGETAEHFLTGAFLPIWDKIPGRDKPKIYRLRTDDGQTAVGRHVPAEQLPALLQNLGIHEEGERYEPAEVHAKVSAGRARARLSNGWTLKPARVQNERRIEVDGVTPAHLPEFKADGGIVERVGYTTRFFLPTGEAGSAALARVLRSRNAAVTSLTETP